MTNFRQVKDFDDQIPCRAYNNTFLATKYVQIGAFKNNENTGRAVKRLGCHHDCDVEFGKLTAKQ